VVPLAEVDGALDGAMRAEAASRNWTDDAGRVILPDHPFTSTSIAAVPTGRVARYDIEMLPRMWSVQPGHSLQLVISSQSPYLTPTAVQLQGLAGGQYTIQDGGRAASYVDLPLEPLDAFPAVGGDPTTVGIG
jgi:uncharacterized protein